ncbi:MAG TPA: hypothetical protein VJR06_03020, partial [Nitrososphaerales archaeon]|nr:hypothetical protein [Nitrososphaerales archaeon]
MKVNTTGGPKRRLGVATVQVLAAVVVAAIAGTAVWYVWGMQPQGTFSFRIQSASAVYDQLSGRTNITVVLLNTGSLPIRLGGTQG